jgi:hypothetical protein
MGWRSFKRFRKTWLRGARCLEDANNFWMAHKPQTMSEVHSHLHEDLQMRLDEAKRVGYGFALPASNNVSVVPNVPKLLESMIYVPIIRTELRSFGLVWSVLRTLSVPHGIHGEPRSLDCGFCLCARDWPKGRPQFQQFH